MLIDMPLERQQSRLVLAGAPFGERAMTTVPGKVLGRIRVALAAFDRGSDLCPALASLDDVKFDPAQLGIAARASSFSRLRSQHVAGTLSGASASQLICGSVPLSLTVAHEPVLISAGPLWPTLACFGTSQGELLVTATWMAAALREDVIRHLANGAILLGVTAKSAEQQRTATQILLNHSSHRVHTLDFRV